LTHKGETYVLFAGDWFVVDKAFHAAVESDFLKLVAKKAVRGIHQKPRASASFIAELDAHKKSA